ncbi:Protein translocase subunit SecA [Vibrio chagasii]|nr:Protein translocase subunit SecA [Vibrio chagasii]
MSKKSLFGRMLQTRRSKNLSRQVLLKFEHYADKSNEELVQIYHSPASTELELLCALSVVSERSLSLKPYSNQVFAASMAANGYVLDMKTGEGKTLVAAMASLLLIKTHASVRIATTNEYLSERDFNWMSPLFNALGVSVSNDHKCSKNSTVIYSTLNSFCLSWLNDNLALSDSSISHDFDSKCAIIIDEIDQTLIESSVTPYSITGSVPVNADNLERSLEIASIVHELCDSVFDEATGAFTDEFFENIQKIYSERYGIQSESFFNSAISELFSVQSAYVALFTLKRDVDYVVMNNSICRVERSTGRTRVGGFSDQVMSALQKKEGVPLSERRQAYITSALPNYVKRFSHITGMSGTAIVNQNELDHIYGISVAIIPLKNKKNLNNLGCRLLENQDCKMNHAIELVTEGVSKGQPVLVVCETDNQSIELHRKLDDRGFNLHIFNSHNPEMEQELISSAGCPKNVLITTRLCCRGTDIILGGGESNASREVVSDLGGLFVISMFAGETEVDDLQVMGRCARQSDSGVFVKLLALDDKLLNLNKVAEFILPACLYSESDTTKLKIEKDKTLNKAILQIQAKKQSSQKDMRSRLMLFDKPISEQLDIMAKLRASIRLSGDASELSAVLWFEDDVDLLGLCAELARVKGESESLTYLKNSSLQILTKKWEGYNSLISSLKGDQINVSQGGYFKYKEECHKHFLNFSRTIKSDLVSELKLLMESEIEMMKAQASLLTEDEINLLKGYVMNY